jgi:dipeptidase D
MSRILKDLKPEKVFYYFEEISKIPRCSNHEKRISEFLYNWAKEKNLEVSQDKALNILIKKKASKGYENSPTVILQGHMDMVCEKNMDTQHDFSKDPLQLRIVDDYIYATGTTLGADNGIAVAFAMAILDSDDIVHPPLEVLITTDEENGMTGVENLDTKNINGKILINLDSEDEGIFTAGCAGGGRVKLMIPVEYKAPNYSNFYKLSIKGLKGGHSGVDIDKERGNSIKLLGRVLYNLKDEIEISSIIGGSKDNAIPRESQAIISCKEEEDLIEYISNWNEIFMNEFAFSDPDVNIVLEKTQNQSTVFNKETSDKIISAINLIPNGPLSRSTDLNMVIYSNNLGVITTDDNKVIITCAPRSSTKSLLNQFVDNIEQIAKLLNIEIDASSFYPGWEYAKESKIRKICLDTYKDIYNKNGTVEVIHAGLECGFLIEKIPGLDAISLGPDMYDIHTPDEHLSISSSKRTFEFLCEILKRIN